MDAPWMNDMSALLAERGIRTARFEFAYMAGRRQGARRPPPRAETLIDEYRLAVAAAAAVTQGPLLIGGKSMGGRVASMIADELFDAGTVAGLICLGYPFHPPGSPEKQRTAHLEELRTPALICQGERDPFGPKAEVTKYELPETIELRWFVDGDHELRPRKGVTGHTQHDYLATAADAMLEFSRRL